MQLVSAGNERHSAAPLARVTGHPTAGGHCFPEQNATETMAELRAFFGLGEPRESRREKS